MRIPSRHSAGAGRPEPEPIKRLSVNLPARLHRRFKTACSAAGPNMAGETQRFVEMSEGQT